jgi:hypothetical protein
MMNKARRHAVGESRSSCSAQDHQAHKSLQTAVASRLLSMHFNAEEQHNSQLAHHSNWPFSHLEFVGVARVGCDGALREVCDSVGPHTSLPHVEPMKMERDAT